ncbi:unnamed protein product [Urochloa humidicola]
MKEQAQTEKALSLERDQLEKARAKELSEFAKSLEKEQVANLKNALREQGVLFAGMKEQERAIADNVLGNTRREKDKIIIKQEQTLDSFYKHARLQFEELQNDVSGLKDMIQNLIEQQEVRPNKKSKVEDEICIPQASLVVLMDNECDLDDVMRFKVHVVDELYPDLKKYYDSREYNVGQFTITNPATTVEFGTMLETLRDYGYRGDAELYYLNPFPGSTPSTGLCKIYGQEQVDDLVLAHAAQRTKICHLYLVRPEDDMADTEYYDDGEEVGDMTP